MARWFRNNSRASCIVLIVLSRWNSLTSGFSKINASNRRQHDMEPQYLPTRGVVETTKDDGATDPSDGLDRRRFFSTMIGLGSIGLAASDAIAVDFGSKLSPMGNNNGGNSGSTTTMAVSKKAGGLANKIRGICLQMDELQRDLMQERWDLLQNYPVQLRSYVPVFTTYTDAAFPSELPSDYGLRVALRYEVGRYFASLERFKRAVSRKALDEAYVAYSDMSLHLDRYLRVGGLYTYYDSTIDNEPLYKAYNDALVYADPIKDPAEVRDLVVLCKGPDKGKTGIVIGIYPDGSNNCAVKLDKFRGMREIRVVPRSWAAKRLGEQDPDDVFLIPRKGSKS